MHETQRPFNTASNIGFFYLQPNNYYIFNKKNSLKNSTMHYKKNDDNDEHSVHRYK